MNAKEFLALIESAVLIEEGEVAFAMNNTKDSASLLAKFDDDIFSVDVKRSRIWPHVSHKDKEEDR